MRWADAVTTKEGHSCRLIEEGPLKEALPCAVDHGELARVPDAAAIPAVPVCPPSVMVLNDRPGRRRDFAVEDSAPRVGVHLGRAAPDEKNDVSAPT